MSLKEILNKYGNKEFNTDLKKKETTFDEILNKYGNNSMADTSTEPDDHATALGLSTLENTLKQQKNNIRLDYNYPKDIQAIKETQSKINDIKNNEWQQGINNYNNLVNNEDFAQNSVPRQNVANDRYTLINGGVVYGDPISEFDNSPSETRFEDDQTINQMSDGEKATYTYIFNTQGQLKADEYIRQMQPILNRRREEANKKKLEEASAGQLVGANALGVGGLVTTPVASADILAQKGRQIYDKLVGNTQVPIDYNTPAQTIANYRSNVREETSSRIENPFVNFLYQTGMSMADSAVGIVLASAGIPNPGFLLGMDAAISSAKEAKARGLDDNSALLTGLFAGIAEEFFEEYSIDKLLTGDLPKDALTRFFNVLKQMGIEGSEEVFTSIANRISDGLINADKSQIQMDIQELVDKGYSLDEATKIVEKNFAKQLALDFAGGAVSGGVFGFGSNIRSNIEAYNRGSQYTKNESAKQSLIDEANKLGGEAQEYASKIKDTNARKTQRQLGYQEILNKYENTNQAISKAQEEYGFKADNMTLRSLQKQANGENLTAFDEARINRYNEENQKRVESANKKEIADNQKVFKEVVLEGKTTTKGTQRKNLTAEEKTFVNKILTETYGNRKANEVIQQRAEQIAYGNEVDNKVARELVRNVKLLNDMTARGVEVEFSAKAFKGKSTHVGYSIGNKVYLNPLASAQSVLRYVAAHELLHRAKVESKEAYDSVVDVFVKDELKYDGDVTFKNGKLVNESAEVRRVIDERKEVYKGIKGEKINDETMFEEAIAHWIEKMSESTDNVEEIFKDHTRAKKFLERLNDSINALAGNTTGIDRQYRKIATIIGKTLNQSTNEERFKVEGKKIVDTKSGTKIETDDSATMHSLTTLSDGAGLEARKVDNTIKFFDKKGNPISKVSVDDIKKSAMGNLVRLSVQNKVITEKDAEQQLESITDLVNMVIHTQEPELVWAYAGASLFSALKSNADNQYTRTVDFTTICRKTENMITALSSAMTKKANKYGKGGLTKDEVILLQKKLIEEGSQVPCPVCYVFSRWAGVGKLLDEIYDLQKMYEGVSKDELRETLAKLEQEVLEEQTTSQSKKSKAINKLLKDKQEEIDKLNAEREKIENNKGIGYKEALKSIDAKLKILEEEKKPLMKYSFAQLVLKDNYKPVPSDILYNLDRAEEFATEYPVVWKFRTTRGSGAGKAILPYSDMVFGDIILGYSGKVPDVPSRREKFGKLGETLNDGQRKAFDTAVKNVKAQNLLGGQRFQSTSDFRYEYALDYFMAFLELQALGSNMQTYTKIIEFADLVGAVGGDCNLSLMPLNAGHEDGHLIFSNVTGINFDGAKIARAKYDSVQTILVGINDTHIRLALRDSEDTLGAYVDFVIPYHASGASIDKFITNLLDNLKEQREAKNYIDFSSVQGDSAKEDINELQAFRRKARSIILTGKASGKRASLSPAELQLLNRKSKDISNMSFDELRAIELKALSGDKNAIKEYESWSAGVLYNLYNKMHSDAYRGVVLTSGQARQVMPHEYWNKSTTRSNAYVNGFIFRSYCYSMGLTPRFSRNICKGSGDFTNEAGYWKLLIDRPMYNNDGTYREQNKISITKLNKEMLTEDYGKQTWGGTDTQGNKLRVEKPDKAKAERASEKFIKEYYSDTEISGTELKDKDNNDINVVLKKFIKGSKIMSGDFAKYLENDDTFEVYGKLSNALLSADKEMLDIAKEEVKTMFESIDENNLGLAALAYKWANEYDQMSKKGFDKETYSKKYGKVYNILKEIVEEIRAERVGGENLKIRKGRYTLDAYKKIFYSLNKNEDMKILADKVFDTCEKLKIPFFVGGSTVTGTNHAGVAFNSTVVINEKHINSKAVSNEDKAKTLLHEAIHSCTNYYMNIYLNDGYRRAFGNLKPEIYDACSTISKIYNSIAFDPIFDGEYGITNEHEMLAELANPKFVEKLKKKNLFERIIDAIKTLFGIETKTAYDGVSQMLETLLTNYDADLVRMQERYFGGRKNSLWDVATRIGGGVNSANDVHDMNPTKFSDTEIDSDGNNLSNGQVTFFKDSKARDANGKLIKMYHGTWNFGFSIFDAGYSDDGLSLFFTDNLDTAKTYSLSKDEARAVSKDNNYIQNAKDSSIESIAEEVTRTHIDGIKKAEVVHDEKGRTYVYVDFYNARKSFPSHGKYEAYSESYFRQFHDPFKRGVYSVYLNLTNPLIVDAKGNYWNKLFGIENGKYDSVSSDGVLTTRNLTKYAKDNGYDGVIFKNIVDNSSNSKEVSTVMTAFNPNQVKSTNNLNPTEDPDIRYSDTEIDTKYMDAVNNNDMETAQELVDEYAKSKGYSIKAYHGTWKPERKNGKKPFTIFNTNGFGSYFSTNKELSKDFARLMNKKGALYSAYIKLQSPFIVDANGKFWNELLTPKEMLDYVGGNTTYTDQIAWFARENGYDGVIIKDIREGDGTKITDDIISFKSNQIKSADPVTYDDNGNVIPLSERFNESNDDIRWSDTELDENDPIYQELLKEFGIMPKSSLRTNDVDVPNKTKNGSVRRFAKSQIESAFSDANYEKKMKEAIANEVMSYKPEGDKKALDYANQTLQNLGFEKALDTFNNAVSTGTMNKDMMVLGERLWMEAANNKDYDTMMDIGSTLAVQGTKYGQMIQAMAIIKKASPQGQLQTIEKFVDQLNKDRLLDPKIKEEVDKISKQKETLQKDIDNLEKKIDQREDKNIAKQKEISKLNEEIALLKQEYDKLKKQTYSDTAKIVRRNYRLQELQKQIEQLTKNLKVVESHLDNLDKEVKELDAKKKQIKELDKVLEKYQVKLSDESIQAILQSETRGELDRAVENAYIEIAEQVPSTWLDKWNAWRYMAMLTNPTTHIRNLIGNAMFVPAMELKNLITYGLQNIYKTDEKTSLKVDKKYKDIATQVYNENAKLLMSSGKYNANDIISEHRRIFKSQVLETIRKGNGGALEVEDAIFLKRSFVEAYSRFIQANPNADKQRAFDYAKEEAWKATYRDANGFADWLNKLEKYNTFTRLGMGAVLPFKKTPLNILKRGMEYSPVGVFKSVYDMTYALKHPNKYPDLTPAKALDELASGLSGTIILLLGMLLTKWGILNGKGDDESSSYEKQVTGFQAYSMNIGNGTYTLDWMSPSAMPLFVGVEIYNAMKGDFEWKGIVDAISNIPAPLFEMSLLSGMMQVISRAKYADGYGEMAMDMGSTMFSNYLGQALPTLGRRLASILDKNTRNTYYNDKTSFFGEDTQRFARQSINKIPFASKSLEPKIDVWGREVTTGFVERTAEALISPGYYSGDKSTSVDNEIIRVFGATGESKAIPETSRKNYYKADGETKYMDINTYTAYSRLDGRTQYNELNKLFKTSYYKSLNDEEKAEAISKMYSYSKWYALKKTFSDYDSDTYEKTQALLDKTGMTYAEYYSLMGAYQDVLDAREYKLDKEGNKEYKVSESEALKKFLKASNLNQYQCQEIFKKRFPTIKNIPSFAK